MVLPVRKLTKTTKREKENHRLASALLKGYVTSLAGNIPPIIMASQPTPRNVTPPEIKGNQWLALNKASFLEGDKLGGFLNGLKDSHGCCNPTFVQSQESVNL